MQVPNGVSRGNLAANVMLYKAEDNYISKRTASYKRRQSFLYY